MRGYAAAPSGNRMSFVFLKKLTEPRIWNRLFCERLSEPLHMNFLSLFVALFGTFRTKVGFDLVLRQLLIGGIVTPFPTNVEEHAPGRKTAQS